MLLSFSFLFFFLNTIDKTLLYTNFMKLCNFLLKILNSFGAR